MPSAQREERFHCIRSPSGSQAESFKQAQSVTSEAHVASLKLRIKHQVQPSCQGSSSAHPRELGIHESQKIKQGTQRYRCKTCNRCKTCKKTFVGTKGTVFYGHHHSQETLLECLAWLAERTSLAAIHQVKGIKEETVLDWLREAAKQVEAIEALRLAHYPLTRAQRDALVLRQALIDVKLMV